MSRGNVLILSFTGFDRLCCILCFKINDDYNMFNVLENEINKTALHCRKFYMSITQRVQFI